jgi:hypothetical protein
MRALALISLCAPALLACAEIGLDARSAAHSRLVEHFAENDARGNLPARADCIVDRLTPRKQAALSVAYHPAEITAIVAGASDQPGLAQCLARAGAS